MSNLIQDFLHRSIANLEDLHRKMQNANLSGELLREVFRTVHTIKGTSQTFGLNKSAYLAHQIENLLAASNHKEVSADEKLEPLISEGFRLLIKTLEERNFEIPPVFIEKLQKFQFEDDQISDLPDLLHEIPAEFLSKLSKQEKTHLISALQNGHHLLILEIGFETASLNEDFKNFRQNLQQKGEIIAALPGSNFASPGEIGFRIIFVTGETTEQIIENCSAEVIFSFDGSFPNNLQGVLTQTVGYGKNLAKKFGKKIEINFQTDSIETQNGKLKLIFDILNHLLKNAVDHAFENEGIVDIFVGTEKNGLRLKVSDNGRGIDPEKIRTAAVEQNFIKNNRVLSEQEILDLIFLPEFSTAETVSEISGRGIGLEAVKNFIENANGKISVKSQKNAGTTFEIFLPV